MEKIRIIIADDHAVVREGLRFLIATEPGLDLVAEAVDGQDALDKIIQLQPDIVLLDLVMPIKSGIQVIEDITQRGLSTRVLVLSSFSEDERVFPAIKSGAFGYLLKDTPTDTLLQAIRDVYHGESAIHPTIARILIKQIHQPGEILPVDQTFSEQEVDVLRYIARGFTNREIAEQMCIEEREVRADTSRILEKLHRANRKQATLYSGQNGGDSDLPANGSAN